MNKIANVVFAYSPKNDDELELTVGDKIEVIGFEEEGWWKGKLRGRIGVFPSNFVEVIENESPQIVQNTNKLNSIFGTKAVSSKSGGSSNSLNTIANNTNTNNNINNSSNNLIMNNTHQQHETDSPNDYPFVSANGSSHSTNSLSERRPKPLRGIGYGDVFGAGAKTKPLPADPTTLKPTSAMASERLSTASLNTLQKPIPKKPPPPAPTEGTNGSASDQAPALPPKPSNQFSPFLHHRYPPTAPTAQQRTVREQARVIYAYVPTNDDELEMEVGDIINIIDKNIEDAGWWKGELNGKVGVFPDNFVQLIEYPDIPNRDWNNSSRLSASTCNSNHSNNTSNSGGFSQQQQTVGTEGKIKSVFAGTPKGFSKELESNLEKHSNPASFLSLKRNKLQQQMPSSLAGDSAPISTSNVEPATSTPSSVAPATSTLMASDTNDKHNGHTSSESSPGKLNHITANRAKGPSRRPPSNILNKRNQFNELSNNHKHEPVDTKEDLPTVSLPVFNQTTPVQPPVNNGSPTSLPPEQHHPLASANIAPTSSSLFEPQSTNDLSSPISMKSSSLANNNIPENQLVTPKSSQRTNQNIGQQPENKSKLSSSSSPSTPPWMVELRKTNAEKKRDPLPPSTAVMIEESIATSTPTVPTTTIAATPVTVTTTAIPTIATTTTSTVAATATTTPAAPAVVSTTESNPSNESVSMKHDSILKQISKNVTNEIIELKNEVKKLREDFKGIGELKEAIDTMKIELRTCQSATESQRRYIKELVNNLADERKKIAAMQVEIDRNLK